MPLDHFDAVVVPNHDGLTGSNVVTTTGALSRVNAERLAHAREDFRAMIEPLPGPRIAVLVGGKSHAFDLSTTRANKLGSDVADICAQTGGSALVTTSRRTPAPAVEGLRAALTATPSILWQSDYSPGPNPYLGFLAWADHVFVTADSVSMLSDAASTGAPLHIVPMDGTRAKLERFHRELVDLGIARHFHGALDTWSPTALAEGERVASVLRGWIGHGEAVRPSATSPSG
jgi:mitochondrial fission protein ELM1